MSQAYSIAAVAKRTGLLPDTIRAWERRYSLVTPERDPSGLRAYSEADIARLELARDATRLGHAIRHVAALSNHDIARLLQASAPVRPIRPEPWLDQLVGRVIEATRAYDFDAAQRALSSSALVLPREEFGLRVLAPLLRQIGDDWSAGTLDVAQEHAVSQIVRNLIGSLVVQASGFETVGGMLFATPPGEAHEFGMFIGALVSSGHGLPITVLGPDLPAADVARAARKLGTGIVVIGSLAPAGDATMHAYVSDLRRDLPIAAELWLGGSHAATWCENVPHTAAFATLEAFAAKLRTLGRGAL